MKINAQFIDSFRVAVAVEKYLHSGRDDGRPRTEPQPFTVRTIYGYDSANEIPTSKDGECGKPLTTSPLCMPMST